MSDLVEKLRDWNYRGNPELMGKAADEIERLDGLLLGAKNAWVIQTLKVERLEKRVDALLKAVGTAFV